MFIQLEEQITTTGQVSNPKWPLSVLEKYSRKRKDIIDYLTIRNFSQFKINNKIYHSLLILVFNCIDNIIKWVHFAKLACKNWDEQDSG